MDAYSHKEKSFGSLQAMDGKLALLSHLLGCCLVAQTQYGLHGPVRDRKVGEALPCFFRYQMILSLLVTGPSPFEMNRIC